MSKIFTLLSLLVAIIPSVSQSNLNVTKKKSTQKKNILFQ